MNGITLFILLISAALSLGQKAATDKAFWGFTDEMEKYTESEWDTWWDNMESKFGEPSENGPEYGDRGGQTNGGGFPRFQDNGAQGTRTNYANRGRGGQTNGGGFPRFQDNGAQGARTNYANRGRGGQTNGGGFPGFQDNGAQGPRTNYANDGRGGRTNGNLRGFQNNGGFP
jgi:hypothetical protein